MQQSPPQRAGLRAHAAHCRLLALGALVLSIAATGCGARAGAAGARDGDAGATGVAIDVRATIADGRTTVLTATGVESAAAGLLAVHMTGRIEAGGATRTFSAEERVVANALYVRSDALPPTQLDGRHWLELTLRDAARILGLDTAAFAATDPERVGAFLRTARPVARPGHPSVAGVRTTRYEVALPASGGRTLPLEVWVDDAGRVRRERCTLRVPGGALETIDTVVRRFGVPVRVAAPTLEDTVEPAPFDHAS